MKILNIFCLSIAIVILLACNKNNIDPGPEIVIPEGYSLVWNDEFDQDIINTDNWQYEIGDGTDYGLPAGWGNDEMQIYTDDAQNSGIAVVDGHSSLLISALEDGNGGYTSAKLVTRELQSIRFGKIEVRAKMAEGQGIWPAIWMLGDNKNLVDWPGCGEIDIAEVIGNQPSVYYSTLHYTNSEKKHGEIQESFELSSGTFSDDYHVFSLDWTPDHISFMVDGNLVQEVPLESDMKEFKRSFYFVLNLAVGGYWPGEPDGTTVFPQSMAVDYIRVFSKDGFVPPEAPVLDIEEETIGQVIEPNIGDNAIKDSFTDLGNLTVISYGGGGEPEVTSSETAIDGDLSLAFTFPGGSWGGAYIQLLDNRNLSGYTYLNFSLKMPFYITDAEIKLESTSTNAAIYIKDYSGTDVTEGFFEYTIPLDAFSGLDLTDLKIPLSIWNPQDAGGNFAGGTILIDNLYFSN